MTYVFLEALGGVNDDQVVGLLTLLELKDADGISVE